jgi:hypothetical protein
MKEMRSTVDNTNTSSMQLAELELWRVFEAVAPL